MVGYRLGTQPDASDKPEDGTPRREVISICPAIPRTTVITVGGVPSGRTRDRVPRREIPEPREPAHAVRKDPQVGRLRPWPKLFQNLRSTRQTEPEEKFPSHALCAWIGNSDQIARKHYRQVTEDHFSRAAGGGAENGARAVQNPVQQPLASICTIPQVKRQTPVFAGVMPLDAVHRRNVRLGLMEDRGLEPLTSCMPCCLIA